MKTSKAKKTLEKMIDEARNRLREADATRRQCEMEIETLQKALARINAREMIERKDDK